MNSVESTLQEKSIPTGFQLSIQHSRLRAQGIFVLDKRLGSRRIHSSSQASGTAAAPFIETELLRR